MTSTIMTDNTAAGRLGANVLAAELVKKYGKAEGDVAAVLFLAGVKSVQDRVDGFKQEIADKYPGMKVVTTRIGDGNITGSLSTMLDVISTFPNLRGVLGDSFYSGLGIGQAVAETKSQDKIMVVTMDSTDDLVKLTRSGVVKAMIVQDLV